MSSALVRQALEFVEQEGIVSKRAKGSVRQTGQDHRQLYKKKNKRVKEIVKTKEEVTEDNIKKLLALSRPTADTTDTQKIVERAIKRKPLAEKVEEKVDDHKSILFPEGETFEDFEQELFCS